MTLNSKLAPKPGKIHRLVVILYLFVKRPQDGNTEGLVPFVQHAGQRPIDRQAAAGMEDSPQGRLQPRFVVGGLADLDVGQQTKTVLRPNMSGPTWECGPSRDLPLRAGRSGCPASCHSRLGNL